VERHYTFEQASDIVQSLAHGYGKWQNEECLSMKDELISMDRDGHGRIPLGRFYAHAGAGDYQFAESEDYLRQIGALDELAEDGPSLLLSNYVSGPTNCIATSSYYSVCCRSECEGLISELEVHVQGPSASPQLLLSLVANLSSSTVDAPREIPEALADKLGEVAARNGGEVPLHGRLFAQWLHYAFPHECPYPHVADSSMRNALKPNQWLQNQAMALPDEMEHYASAFVSSNSSGEQPVAPSLHLWTDEELLMHEDEHPILLRFVNAVRVVGMGSALLFMLNRALLTMSGWRDNMPLDTKKQAAILSCLA